MEDEDAKKKDYLKIINQFKFDISSASSHYNSSSFLPFILYYYDYIYFVK